MADNVASIFGLANTSAPENIAKNYQEGLTKGMENKAKAMNLTMSQQAFADQQAQRQALQQNVDQAGNLNAPAAVSQLSKQNPLMAQQLDKMIRQNGLEQTHQKMQEANDFWAGVDEKNYAEKKQEMIDKGHQEFSKLPDVYMESVKNKGLMSTMSGAQQVEHLMKQREIAAGILSKYAENQVVPPPEIVEAAGFALPGQQPRDASQKMLPKGMQPPSGLRPGDAIPMGKRDVEAQKAYDDALGARKQNDPAYATAGSNLLAVKNAMSIFEKYKDLNDISTQDQHILAGEAAKAIKGGASPTEQEKNDLMPNNLKSMSADKWALFSSKPMPTNNAEYYQGLKNYFGDLRNNSMNTIKSAHDYAAQTAVARGINKDSLSIKQRAADKELQDLAYGQQKKGMSGVPSDRVTVVDPTGRIGHIPKSQLQEALNKGYKQQ